MTPQKGNQNQQSAPKTPSSAAATAPLLDLLARLIARHHLRVTTEAARGGYDDEASDADKS